MVSCLLVTAAAVQPRAPLLRAGLPGLLGVPQEPVLLSNASRAGLNETHPRRWPLSLPCAKPGDTRAIPGYIKHETYDRSYLSYMPQDVCHGGAVAVLVLIHCYGCTPAEILYPFVDVARERHFALIAPTGMGNSFNAEFCCGLARDHKLDDVGFVKSILLRELGNVPQVPIFMAGFSNGGSFTYKFAADVPYLLAGIAPMAGTYPYDPAGLARIPVLILQIKDDPGVRYTGCCQDPSMPECCCGQSQCAPYHCVGTEQIFSTVRNLNGCSGELLHAIPRAKCRTAVGCYGQKAAKLCVYDDGVVQHKDWQHHPPANEVAQFLVQTLENHV